MTTGAVWVCSMDEEACRICGDMDHLTADCTAPPIRARRSAFAPERARWAGPRSRTTPGFRPDGFCRHCDERHQVGAPCAQPAPPPAGWRELVRGGDPNE